MQILAKCTHTKKEVSDNPQNCISGVTLGMFYNIFSETKPMFKGIRYMSPLHVWGTNIIYDLIENSNI